MLDIMSARMPDLQELKWLFQNAVEEAKEEMFGSKEMAAKLENENRVLVIDCCWAAFRFTHRELDHRQFRFADGNNQPIAEVTAALHMATVNQSTGVERPMLVAALMWDHNDLDKTEFVGGITSTDGGLVATIYGKLSSELFRRWPMS